MTAKRMNRWGGPAAVAAGVLWGTQGLIWTLGPKVQATDPPYGVINRPLFALFWLAIVGAILCSAAALLGLHGRQRARAGLVGGASAAVAGATVVVAGSAGVAVVLAALGVAEEASVGVLSLALNLSGLVLLVALALAGVATVRAGALHGWQALLPAVLAFLTFLTLGAILASGSRALAGLSFAVAVVTVSGATWVLLGWALRPRPQPQVA
jgi:hypothetical protein